MGGITEYPTSAGKRYRVRYRKPDRTQTDKRGFKTKRDAQLFLASVEVKKSSGEFIDPTLGKATLTYLGRKWLDGRTHLKPSSKAVYESAWRLHVEPTWGHRPINGISHSEIQAWVTRTPPRHRRGHQTKIRHPSPPLPRPPHRNPQQRRTRQTPPIKPRPRHKTPPKNLPRTPIPHTQPSRRSRSSLW